MEKTVIRNAWIQKIFGNQATAILLLALNLREVMITMMVPKASHGSKVLYVHLGKSRDIMAFLNCGRES